MSRTVNSAIARIREIDPELTATDSDLRHLLIEYQEDRFLRPVNLTDEDLVNIMAEFYHREGHDVEHIVQAIRNLLDEVRGPTSQEPHMFSFGCIRRIRELDPHLRATDRDILDLVRRYAGTDDDLDLDDLDLVEVIDHAYAHLGVGMLKRIERMRAHRSAVAPALP